MEENFTLPTLVSTDFPPALRAFWDAAPTPFKVPSFLAATVCYCALGTRLRFKYTYDNDLHALLLQVIVVAEAASGKSFTRPIVNLIMKQLRLRDKEMKRIEQDYQDLKKTASKTKKLPEEPITDVRCLQTITKAKLVKRADMFMRKYGEPLAFFFYNEELATMTESNKRAFADLRTMDRLAYDLGAEYGSDTLSDASYNADVDVLYCSLFCATDNALREYMDKRSVEGGNCTRKVIVDLGDFLGDDAPRFRPLTEEEIKTVNNTVNLLMESTYKNDNSLQPTYIVQMNWLDYHVRRWCSEQRTLVLKTGSRARNCFYKRASVSAARIACMVYYLWGEDPNKQRNVARLYRFMASYIVEGLIQRWGKKYEEMHKNDIDEMSDVNVSLFDTLPDEFSRDQLREQIVKLNLSTPARIFIYKWKKSRLIHLSPDNENVYVKNY